MGRCFQFLGYMRFDAANSLIGLCPKVVDNLRCSPNILDIFHMQFKKIHIMFCHFLSVTLVFHLLIARILVATRHLSQSSPRQFHRKSPTWAMVQRFVQVPVGGILLTGVSNGYSTMGWMKIRSFPDVLIYTFLFIASMSLKLGMLCYRLLANTVPG